MIIVNEERVTRFHGEPGTPTREWFQHYLEVLEGQRDGTMVDGVRPMEVVLLHALTTGHMSYGDSRRLSDWLQKDQLSRALFEKIRKELGTNNDLSYY